MCNWPDVRHLRCGSIANVAVLAGADMHGCHRRRYPRQLSPLHLATLDYHRGHYLWGGVYNAELMRLLRDGFAPCPVAPPEAYGYPNEALEAILFTLLAYATVYGRPGNVPGATGVRRAVVLGKIVPA